MQETRTDQMLQWSSTFGREYTDRNPQTPEEMDALYVRIFGMTRTAINAEFLAGMDRSIRILEVGSNVGTQLRILQQMGFTNLYGVELQPYAVELARSRSSGINLIQGSAFDLPFKDRYFDLVFTSGVLIHIAPTDVGRALDEIHRCSNTHIWGLEYYAEEYTPIPYRGHQALMWKTNFAKLYLDRHSDLRLVKQRKIKYIADENVDEVYLLAR